MVLHDFRVFGAYSLPTATPIARAKYSIESTYYHSVMVAGRHRQGADRFAMRTRKLSPGLAPVIGAEDTAFGVVEQAPTGHVNRCRVCRVEDNMIENVIFAESELSKQLPGITTVV